MKSRRQTLQSLALSAVSMIGLTQCGRRSRPMTVTWDAATPSAPPKDFAVLSFPKAMPNRILRRLDGGPAETLDRALLCELSEFGSGKDITVYLADSTECLVSPLEIQPEPDPASLTNSVAALNRTITSWGKETSYKSVTFQCVKAPSGVWTADLVRRSEKRHERFEYDIKGGIVIPRRISSRSTLLEF